MPQKSDLPAYEDLEPAAVWKFFAGLAAHPRPSKKEEQVRIHLEGVARTLNLTTRTDAVGNLVIEVPATPGCETAPVTVLQGHLDMVCEKNSGTSHDFDRDPIKLIVDRDPEEGRIVVRADGTTLTPTTASGSRSLWPPPSRPRSPTGRWRFSAPSTRRWAWVGPMRSHRSSFAADVC
jgi:hypothetical protein